MNELENKIEQQEKYIEVKEQECDDLQDRIDEAIELIELKQLRYLNENDYRINTLDLQEVKDILKGNNK